MQLITRIVTLSILAVLLSMLQTATVEAQLPIEDVGVRNVEFQDGPIEFPNGVTQAGFEFYATDGVTLEGRYSVGCVVCLGALAFDFSDENDIISEMSGDGLWMWDEWEMKGTCIVGKINTDLALGTIGKVYFPVKATEFNDANEPYYSANLVNVNLQPHPYDPSYDSNDHVYGYTYTVPSGDCLENVFVTSELPSTTVRASNQIKSDINLNHVDPISFYAGQEVMMISGFEVVPGTEFLADIRPCEP